MKTSIASALKTGAAPLVLGMALVSAPAWAQQGSTSTEDANTIVVTATRIIHPELVAQSPVTSISAADIKMTGATRIEDVLNAMPQAFVSQSSTVSNGSDGTATANLRNIGDTRTLVLVNGLRLPAGDPVRDAGNLLGSAADLNMIPSFMVKRVEVVTGGASSTYGADAVAGVVNFILDDKYDGLKFDAQGSIFQHNNNSSVAAAAITSDPRYNQAYNGMTLPHGNSFDGGTYTLSGVGGMKLADGAAHVTVYASYHHQAAVLLSSRDFSNCGLGSNELDNGPGAASSSQATDFYCAGSSNSARTSMLINGGAGGGLGNPAGTRLIVDPGSGIRTFDGGTDVYNFNPTNYFQRPDDRWNAGAFFSYDVSDALKTYANVMFMKDNSKAQIAPSGTFNNVFTINCSNPYILANGAAIASAMGCTAPGPASLQTVQVALAKRNVEGGGRLDDLTHTDYRIVIGAKGDLSPAWSYDAHYQYGAVDYKETYYNDFSRSRVQMAINACLNPDGTAVADTSCAGYNIFSGTTTIQSSAAAGVTQAAVDYVNTPGHKSGKLEEHVASFVINGDLASYGIKSPLASRGVRIAFGPEFRRETLNLVTDTEFATGDLLGQGGETKSTAGAFNVAEAMLEADIPLVSGVTGFQDLSLDAAYRFSHYTTVGDTHTWKFALSWAPFKDEFEKVLRIRASIASAVRAPTIQDYYAPSQLNLGGSTDICAQRSKGRASSADLAGCLNTAGTDPNFASQWAAGLGIARNPASQYNTVTAGAVALGTTLKPETAITKTFGFVFEPKPWVPGFTFTMDYYDINLKDRIGTDGYTAIFNQCYNTGSAYYCGLIHRDPANGSLWLTPNGYILDPVYNTGHLKTNGIDFTANYTHRFEKYGKLSVAFNGTYVFHYKTEVMLHQADGSVVSNGYYDCVGYYDDGSACGVPNPHWRHNVRVTYAPNEQISATVNWRHIGSSDTSAANPATALDGSGQLINWGGYTLADVPNSHIPKYDYFDMALSYTPIRNLELRLGVDNLFDRDPPIIPGGEYNVGNMNGNSFGGMYDVLGRTLFMGVTYKY